MIEKLKTNNIFFKNLKDKIFTESAKCIQNYWRSIANRFKKYRNAVKVLKMKKKLKILLRWYKLCKKSKKPANKRIPSKPQGVEVTDEPRRNIVSDANATKTINTSRRRMTNIKRINFNATAIVQASLLSSISKGRI